MTIPKDLMYHKFRAYGFLKNLRFFDPFLILFFRQMGLSFFQIGVLFSIREIAINVLEIPTGVVADSCGRRKAMIASFSFYLLSFGLFYLSPSFSIFALAMVIFAFGETLRSGTHTWRPASQLKPSFGTLLMVGIAPLAGFLADRIGVGEALVIIAVVVALGSIALRLRGGESQ